MTPGRRSATRPRLRAFARAVATIGSALLTAYATDRALAQAPDPATAARLMDDLMWGRGHVGGPFELIDQTGRTRTDGDFRGKLLIVYFGYTYCPDICPTDLMQIGLAIDKLGAAGAQVQPLFISIDPERDTPSVLADYVSMFNPRIVGLTGPPAQVRAVADDRSHGFHLSDGPVGRISRLLSTRHISRPNGGDHPSASGSGRLARK